MAKPLRPAVLLLSGLILVLFLAGCPKRPMTNIASAPPPTTPVPTVPGPAAPPPAAATAPSAPPSIAPRPATPAPGTPPPKASEYTASESLKDIHFDFDRYDIRPSEMKTLDANAAWLKAHGNSLVLIEGHCDERGTAEYNLALGERRAKATMNYLVSRGIQASRITITSFGKERPLCVQHSETCWAKNRRAHVLVKDR